MGKDMDEVEEMERNLLKMGCSPDQAKHRMPKIAKRAVKKARRVRNNHKKRTKHFRWER
jgi:hypothetical protein